jgi:hypothetical protein
LLVRLHRPHVGAWVPRGSSSRGGQIWPTPFQFPTLGFGQIEIDLLSLKLLIRRSRAFRHT